jgi:hypothetical protein
MSAQFFLSTRNERGHCVPILAIVLLCCICQRAVFICCSFTHACGRLVALGVQGVVPSIHALLFVRPVTSAAISAHFLPLRFFTASFSSLSSSGVHVPTRAVVSSTPCFVRPGTSNPICPAIILAGRILLLCLYCCTRSQL